MGNDLACRLPSINLLSLDLPLPHYYPVQYDQYPLLVPRHQPYLLVMPPQVPLQYVYPSPVSVAMSAAPHPLVAAAPKSELGAAPPIVSATNPAQLSAKLPLPEMVLGHIVAPAANTANAAANANAAAAAGVPAGLASSGPVSPALSSLPHSSRLLVSLEVPRPKLSALLTPASPKSPELHKDWKPRKKRQCPECHLYFSNLATHRSTHLKPTLRPHVCKLCQRGFARPNDLFRHFKRHWKEIGADNGQFRCPFKNGPHGDHCCHTLGIFSRCDTYKNHLKAIHFQYPGGTRKSQRNQVPGTCRLCQAQFRNVDEWIATHIDTHQCPYGNR